MSRRRIRRDGIGIDRRIWIGIGMGGGEMHNGMHTFEFFGKHGIKV